VAAGLVSGVAFGFNKGFDFSFSAFEKPMDEAQLYTTTDYISGMPNDLKRLLSRVVGGAA
jgi:hypothetical protein